MKLLRSIAAVVMGVILGGSVNMALVVLGPLVVPPPPGVDFSNPQSLAAGIHLLQPVHFLFPFLAHAVGTLAGAMVACLIASHGRTRVANAVGVIFAVGGIAAARMIPAPAWFVVADLGLAYFPMAWAGAQLGLRLRQPINPVDSATGGRPAAPAS